jgi:hypothetical protein
MTDFLSQVTFEEIENSVENLILNFGDLQINSDFYKKKYIESCCWLVEEVEELIKILNKKKNNNFINKKYTFDLGNNILHCLALTTNFEKNTNIGDIQKTWNQINYEMPFYLVKKIYEKKGYTINSYSNNTNPEKIKNEKLYDPYCDFHHKPIETFELEIKANSKKRDKDYCHEENEESEPKVKKHKI